MEEYNNNLMKRVGAVGSLFGQDRQSGDSMCLKHSNVGYMRKIFINAGGSRIHSLRLVILLILLLGNIQLLIAGTTLDLAQGQAIQVSGTVRAASNGETLPGVSIYVKGMMQYGTVTDFEGNYSLHIPSADATLIFSFVGYRTLEVPVQGRNTVNVVLEERAELLDEVVVVGYGTQRRVNLTGSVSTVSDDLFQDRGAMTNPLHALQGAVPGVVVSRSSGAPGRESFNFEIRGTSSINRPDVLVIIDGVPGDINNLNPEDIDNISFLKDASAAIYGARAAGGVVLVTTKRGKRNDNIQVNYKGSFNVSRPGLQMKYMDMARYMETYEEASVNDNPALAGGDLNIYPRFVVDAYKTRDPEYMNSYVNWSQGDIWDYTFFDTNWNEVMYGNGFSQSHTMNVSGGSENTAYLFSLGYLNDDGMLNYGADGFERYNMRLNYDYQISERLQLEVSAAYEHSEGARPTRNYNPHLAQPGFPTSNINGDPYAWGGQLTPNWIAEIGGDTYTKQNSLMTNFRLTADLTNDLKFFGNASFNPRGSDVRSWENKIDWYYYDGRFNQTLPNRDNVYRATGNTLYQNYTGYFQYDKVFGGRHDLTVMAGSSFEKNKSEGFNIRTYDLISTAIYNLGLGDIVGTTPAINESRNAWALGSYFSRLNYVYDNRYLLEVNFRYDGSSRFVAEHRWKPFYGASAGWRISQESFMSGVELFENLMLRASYGVMGNQTGIGLYDYAALLNINTPSGTVNGNFPLLGPHGSAFVGQTITQANVVSLSRTWENIETRNVGLDFDMLRGRLQGSFDLFHKINNGMLISVTYPTMFGATPPRTNSGKMETRGWELSMNWRDRIGEFGYRFGFNISDNTNKLVEMEGAQAFLPGLNSTVEGFPINSYFGYRRDGLIMSEEELQEYLQLGGVIPSNLRVGDMKFKDLNNDGALTADDIEYLGDYNIRYSYSFNLGANWKGIDFTAYFQGVGLRDLVRDAPQRAPFVGGWWRGQNDAWYGVAYSDMYDRRSPDLFPKLTLNSAINNYNYATADWLMENGAYLRMKNIVIGYTLPESLLNRWVSSVRVYFSGNDLFEIQHIRDGWDPETVRNPNEGDNRYPFSRTYSFGIDLRF